MAQSALQNCDICVRAPGVEYCVNCEQYFCSSCKALHKRQKVSRNHEFQDGSNINQEVKSKCEEHKEDFIFLCTTCEVTVCKKCVAGKHRGHEMSDIDDLIQELKEAAKRGMHSKLNTAKTNLLEMEQGLKNIDSDIKAVIQLIRQDGSRIKAMVDKEVENLVASVQNKARQEKEKLSNMISSAKGLVNQTQVLENRREKLQQERENSSLIHKLKSINDDMSRLQISDVPVFPSFQYTSKSTTDKEISNLLGSMSFCETNARQERNPGTKKSVALKEKQNVEKKTRYLYRCPVCREEKVCDERYNYPWCPECFPGFIRMIFVKEV